MAFRARLRSVIRDISIILLVTVVLGEIGARLISSITPAGLPIFLNVALPPLRPSDSDIRSSLALFSHDHLLARDPDIGWIVRPNRSEEGDETNSQGIRTSRDRLFSGDPPQGKVRIETFGDSYVYCLQVRNGETWQDYIETDRADVEFLNFGTPGFGVDQAFLRWKRDGRRFNSDIVILGIWPDDIFRNLIIMDYYRGQVAVSLTKPRFVLSGSSSAQLVNYPIMSNEELISTLSHPENNPILKYDFWYRNEQTTVTPLRWVRLVQVAEGVWYRYERKLTYQKLFTGEISEGLDVTFMIAKLFSEEVRAAGAIPIILMIPDRTRLDLELGSKSVPLVKRMREAGMNVIDMGATFGNRVRVEGAAKYYVGGVGHNSPLGNRVFATYLETELEPYIKQVRAKKNLVN